MWDEITHPFPNFQRLHCCKFWNGEVISSHTLLDMCSMLRFKLIHVSTRVPRCLFWALPGPIITQCSILWYHLQTSNDKHRTSGRLWTSWRQDVGPICYKVWDGVLRLNYRDSTIFWKKLSVKQWDSVAFIHAFCSPGNWCPGRVSCTGRQGWRPATEPPLQTLPERWIGMFATEQARAGPALLSTSPLCARDER